MAILHIEICPDDISTRPYDQNILTCLYATKYDTHRDHLDSTAPLHGILPVYGLRCSMSTTVPLQPLTKLQSQRPLCHFINRNSSDASVIQHKRPHWNQNFCADHCSWLDLTHCYQLDLNHWIQFYSTPVAPISFKSSHIIRAPIQSSFRDSYIGQSVLRITQHQNCGLFHNDKNSNWFCQGHSNFSKNWEKEGRRWEKQTTPLPNCQP